MAVTISTIFMGYDITFYLLSRLGIGGSFRGFHLNFSTMIAFTHSPSTQCGGQSNSQASPTILSGTGSMTTGWIPGSSGPARAKLWPTHLLPGPQAPTLTGGHDDALGLWIARSTMFLSKSPKIVWLFVGIIVSLPSPNKFHMSAPLYLPQHSLSPGYFSRTPRMKSLAILNHYTTSCQGLSISHLLTRKIFPSFSRWRVNISQTLLLSPFFSAYPQYHLC